MARWVGGHNGGFPGVGGVVAWFGGVGGGVGVVCCVFLGGVVVLCGGWAWGLVVGLWGDVG
ncbi:hypothetical protein RA265_27825 [Pseudomonas syringae pv. tagetis]|uniref:hypothetical protein n=1 Tax=Pseudomonas syringae group genomosp. 7 TaxID=251699 RepID=UPI00376F7A4B